MGLIKLDSSHDDCRIGLYRIPFLLGLMIVLPVPLLRVKKVVGVSP